MTSNFNSIKKRLELSTTLPMGTGTSGNAVFLGGAAHHYDNGHTHNKDGSCCNHNNDQRQTEIVSEVSNDVVEDECDEDHTNPSGGCGCC